MLPRNPWSSLKPDMPQARSLWIHEVIGTGKSLLSVSKQLKTSRGFNLILMPRFLGVYHHFLKLVVHSPSQLPLLLTVEPGTMWFPLLLVSSWILIMFSWFYPSKASARKRHGRKMGVERPSSSFIALDHRRPVSVDKGLIDTSQQAGIDTHE